MITPMEEVKAFQDQLAQSLKTNYAKAFDEKFKPLFFDNPRRFLQKKQIAKQLQAYCDIQLTHFAQIPYFVSHFENLVESNKLIDPEGFFDSLHHKPVNGSLGRLLRGHLDYLRVFEEKIYCKKEDVNQYIEILHHGLAILEEKRFASYYDQYLLIPRFHLAKLEHLKNSLKNKSEIIQVEQIQTITNEFFGFEKSPESTFSRKLLDYQKIRIDHDIAALLKQEKFLKLSVENRLQYVLTREIVRNFADCLLIEEKKLFWRWYVYAENSHLKNKVNQHRLIYGVNIAEQASEYYLRYKDLDYNNVKKFYYEKHSKLDILNNDILKSSVLGLLDNVDTDNAALLKEIKNLIDEHLKTLSDLKSLEKDKNWELLWKFDNTKWGKILHSLQEELLSKPLQKMNEYISSAAITNRLQAASIIDLCNHARDTLNQVAQLETRMSDSQDCAMNSNNQSLNFHARHSKV